MSTIGQRWQRATFIAAVLVAAAVIAATQFVHPTLPTSAVAPDDPPGGVPLLYVLGRQPHTLVAYDWSGRRRGSITLPSWVLRQDVRMAPDGGAFRIDASGIGNSDTYYLDRLGRTILELNGETLGSEVWADDNRHLCVLAGFQLVVQFPGSPDRIANIPEGIDGLPEQANLAACSIRSDTAVLELAGQPETSVAAVRVSLSTGQVINDRTFTGGASLVVSADASMVAVGYALNGPTEVYRAADLSTPAAKLDRLFAPLAFSGDDASLLTTPGSEGSAGVQLVNWKSGQRRWRVDEVPAWVGPILARSQSSDFAFALADPNGDPNAILMIHNGIPTQLAFGRPVTW